MMVGVAVEEVREAILEAYARKELAETLFTLMAVSLDNEVDPGPFGSQVFDLIRWADRRGREVELVRALARARPANRAMQSIYKKYGMAIALQAEHDGVGVEGAPADAADSGLQKLVKPTLELAEFRPWLERMTEVEAQVCLITCDDSAVGTGFLVGPDIVLTNWHVMKPALEGPTAATRFSCLFDYKRLADGTRTGRRELLHATDWNVDACPHTEPEGRGRPDETVPTLDELDYSLVRLAEAVGAQPWALHPGADAGAPLRGWQRLPAPAYPYVSPMGAMIAQHPAGWPLKLAIDTAGIDKARGRWLNANGTRIRYANNTLAGSSGSPVFDLDWNLVALHHYGDPFYGHPRYNQGIPISLIRERLRRNGKEWVLEGSGGAGEGSAAGRRGE